MSINFDEVLELILRMDKLLFEWSIIYVNQQWLTEFCTEFTQIKYFVFPLLIFLPFYFVKQKKNCLTFLLCLFVLVCFSEFFVSSLKVFFGRLRPGVMTGLYLKTDAYSFPSAHAWNSMALFVFIGLWFRRLQYFFILLSIFVGIARFLSNNHFLLDVFCGFLGGGLWGYLFFKCLLWVERVSKKHNFLDLPKHAPQK